MQRRPGVRAPGAAGRRRGYVLKEAADAELVEAVRAAASGGTYLNPAAGRTHGASPPPRQRPDPTI